MTKFSQEDGIEDNVDDVVGDIVRKILACPKRDLVYLDLRDQLFKVIEAEKYLIFTANVTNYGTWWISKSKLFFVPEDRRGALSIFRGKTIRLLCVGSGRYTRQLAAAVVKLGPKKNSEVIAQFKSNQAHLNKEKSENESYLKKYLREMRILGSNRSDGLIFIEAKEISSPVSTWTEILALKKLIDGRWQLLQGKLAILGSIYESDAKKYYTQDGNLKIPKSYGGQRIIGLADDEFFVINKLDTEYESNPFSPREFEIYRPFLVEHDWMEINVFRKISKYVGY